MFWNRAKAFCFNPFTAEFRTPKRPYFVHFCARENKIRGRFAVKLMEERPRTYPHTWEPWMGHFDPIKMQSAIFRCDRNEIYAIFPISDIYFAYFYRQLHNGFVFKFLSHKC
jgi:hypothetical protein